MSTINATRKSTDTSIVQLVYALSISLFFIFVFILFSVIVLENDEEMLHNRIKHYHLETIQIALASIDEVHSTRQWFDQFPEKSKIIPYLGVHPNDKAEVTTGLLKKSVEKISAIQNRFKQPKFNVIIKTIDLTTESVTKALNDATKNTHTKEESSHKHNSISIDTDKLFFPLTASYRQLIKLHKTDLKQAHSDNKLLESGNTLSIFTTIVLLFIAGFIILFLVIKKIRETLANQSSLFNALRSSDEQVHLLLSSSSEAIYGIDLNGKCTFSNNACAHLLGYDSPDELLGKNMHELVHHSHSDNTDYPAEECKIYQAFRDGQSSHSDEEVFWRKNGESFPVEYWSNPIIREHKVLGSVINFIDISDKKENEKLLARKQNTLDKAQEIAHIGSWDWDIQTDELYWSDETFRIFGYEPQSFKAGYDNFIKNIHSDDRHAVTKAIEDSLKENGKSYDIEHRIVKLDGKERIVHEQGIVYRDKNLMPYRMIGTVLDITERREAENELHVYRTHLETLVNERTKKLEETRDELIRSERLATLGKLTATVSHELRNPLGAMRPSLHIIKNKEKGVDDTHVQEAIARVDRNITRCDHIIDELLDFTRSSKPMTQHMVIDDWINLLLNEQTIPENIKLKRELNTGKVTASFDPERMRRALINIIENAFHAALDKNNNTSNPVVTVSTNIVNNLIEIVIKDNGIGIPDDILPNIFEPLFSTKSFGVGLGMPIVKQIIEQHKGNIFINTQTGEGTSVVLQFPVRLNKGAAA